MKRLLEFNHKVWVLAIVCSQLFFDIYGQTACSTYGDESSCNTGDGTGYCAWDSVNSRCECSNSMNQDIIFIIDASDNMDDTEFGYIKTFVTNILSHASPIGTRVAISTFTTSIKSIIELQDNVDAETAILNVSSLTRTGSSSMTGVTAVSWAQTQFETYSTSERRVLFTIIGGISSGKLCSDTIHVNTYNIDSYVIAVGEGWQKRVYRCLGKTNNNFEGLIAIDTISDLPDSTQQHTAELFSCPHNPLITITEIHPNGALPTVEFVEFYNKGENISQSRIGFEGFFGGSLVGSDIIAQGTYTVIYDSSGGHNRLPNCTFCSCDKDTSQSELAATCADANYYGCGTDNTAGSFEYSTSNCYVQYGGYTVDNFTISIIDTDTGGTLDSVSNDGSDEYFVSIPTKYSHELIYTGYNNGYGSSWGMSCDEYGTPGDSRYGCHASGGCQSTNTFCRAGGDDLATCSTNTCSCSEFYYNYNNITCKPMPSPLNCTGDFDSPTNNYVLDQPNWDGILYYEATYCDSQVGKPTSISNCTDPFPSVTRYGLPIKVTASGTEGWNVFPAEIRLLDVYSSGAYYSDIVSCDTVTNAPTPNPTPAPTYSLPNVSSCEYTLDQDLLAFNVTWDAVTLTEYTPPSSDLIGYYYIKTSGSGVSIGDCCSAYVEITPAFVVGSDSVRIAPNFGSFSFSEELSIATTCVEYTQVPTTSPTGYPSEPPTEIPSNEPTKQPTMAPTYESLTIDSCSVTFVAGTTNEVVIDWDIPTFLNETTVDESDVTYLVFFNGSSAIEYDYQDVPPVTRQLVTVPDWNENIKMKIKVSTSIDPSGDNYPSTVCDKNSSAPTRSPTKVPSVEPTPKPTGIPSVPPTAAPSLSPTAAPTYIYPNLTWCNASFTSKNDKVTVSWELLDLDNPSYVDTPNPSQVQYTIKGIGTTSSRTQEQLGNITVASVTFALSNSYTLTTVYMYVTYTNTGQQSSYIYCDGNTVSPSVSPTLEPTYLPTSSPTYSSVYVWLYTDDLTYCEDLIGHCGCNETSNDYECESYDSPIEYVKEFKDREATFSIERSFSKYPYDIGVKYHFDIVTTEMASDYGFYQFYSEYIASSIDRNGNVSVSYFIPNDTWFESANLNSRSTVGPTYYDMTSSWNGTAIISASSNNPFGEISGLFVEEDQDLLDGGSIGKDKDGEVFMLTLDSCFIDANGSGLSSSLLSDRDYGDDIYNNNSCVLSYPYRLFIVVEDLNYETETDTKNVDNTTYNEWLWWVLLGIAIFLGILSYIVYRWWVNKRIKEQDVMDIEADVDAVIVEQEQGFANDLGKDNVNFNPLAKPLAHISGPKDGTNGNSSNGQSGEIQDRAQVHVEKFNVRQEFGPTQAAQRNAY